MKMFGERGEGGGEVEAFPLPLFPIPLKIFSTHFDLV